MAPSRRKKKGATSNEDASAAAAAFKAKILGAINETIAPEIKGVADSDSGPDSDIVNVAAVLAALRDRAQLEPSVAETYASIALGEFARKLGPMVEWAVKTLDGGASPSRAAHRAGLAKILRALGQGLVPEGWHLACALDGLNDGYSSVYFERSGPKRKLDSGTVAARINALCDIAYQLGRTAVLGRRETVAQLYKKVTGFENVDNAAKEIRRWAAQLQVQLPQSHQPAEARLQRAAENGERAAGLQALIEDRFMWGKASASPLGTKLEMPSLFPSPRPKP